MKKSRFEYECISNCENIIVFSLTIFCDPMNLMVVQR